MWLKTQGHNHAPGEHCSAKYKDGKYKFFKQKVGDTGRAEKFGLVLGYCPLDCVDFHLLRIGQMHATDSRILNLDSSADFVLKVLAISEYYQTIRIANAAGFVMMGAKDG